MKLKEIKKIRGKKLHFKTYDDYDAFSTGKDIQNCEIVVDEVLSGGDICKRYDGLLINVRTGKVINYLGKAMKEKQICPACGEPIKPFASSGRQIVTVFKRGIWHLDCWTKTQNERKPTK